MINLFQSQTTGSSLLPLLMVLAISIGLFILLRQLVLWYWKVNTIVENQEKNNLLLKSILAELQSPGSTQTKAAKYDAIEEAKRREHSKI